MKRYIEYIKPGSTTPTTIYNERFEPIGFITFTSDPNNPIKAKMSEQSFTIISHPKMRQGRYIITKDGTGETAKINVGVKILHAVIEHDTYYFVKAAFWKLRYKLYNDRTLRGELTVIRKDAKRYYMVASSNDDPLHILGFFFVAHAVRIKKIFI